MSTWTCYVCLNTFNNETKKGYDCERCTEGNICMSCSQTYMVTFNTCGLCRHSIRNEIIIEYKNRETNNDNFNHRTEFSRHPHLFGFLSNFLLFLLCFSILLCDTVFYIVIIKAKKKSCTFSDITILYVCFGVKCIIMLFQNSAHILCFSRSMHVMYLCGIENIIFNCYTYISFTLYPVCDYYNKLFFEYAIFCVVSFILNASIYTIIKRYNNRGRLEIGQSGTERTIYSVI